MAFPKLVVPSVQKYTQFEPEDCRVTPMLENVADVEPSPTIHVTVGHVIVADPPLTI